MLTYYRVCCAFSSVCALLLSLICGFETTSRVNYYRRLQICNYFWIGPEPVLCLTNKFASAIEHFGIKTPAVAGRQKSKAV
jgi:hypothetical protein